MGCLFGGDGAQAGGADGPGLLEPLDGGLLGSPSRLITGGLPLDLLQLALDLLLQAAELGERLVGLHLAQRLRPRQEVLDPGLPVSDGSA